MNIMISYRRADSGPITGRIYDRLRAHFGSNHVFIDIDSIPMGIDYRQHIHSSIGDCDILLPVIGPRWTGPGEVGKRRIDDPGDLVHIEVAHALERNIRVIPLLVEDARLPGTSELPDDLKALRFRNALRVDSGIDFHHHIDRLCAAIEAAAREAARSIVGENHTIPSTTAAGAPSAQKPLDAARSSPAATPAAQFLKRFEEQIKSGLAHARPLFSRFTKSKWYLPTLGAVVLLFVCLAILRFFPRSASQIGIKEDITRKMTRVPDPRHFPAGSVGTQLVGRWKQGDASFLFFEDSTFATEDPAKGGDEGRWELSGRHVIAKGIPSHPTRTWMLTLSSDGRILSGRVSDEWGNSEPVTLRRQ